MQGVSGGQDAACLLVNRQKEYRTWKIDLSGIIYHFTDETLESRFQLRFSKNGDTWFDTEVLPVRDLSGHLLASKIVEASSINGAAPLIPYQGLRGWLGHPVESELIVNNDELIPDWPVTWYPGYKVPSEVGSWLISFNKSILPEGFDIDLLFSNDESNPVQLAGPAIMVLYEIAETPTSEIVIATDIMGVPSPTPLRAGTLVVCGPFGDVDYGIIAAYPKEYLFTEEV